MSFNSCLDNVLKSEGGYSDDAFDSGGATNFGITIKEYSEFLGRAATKKEVRDMPLDDARKIYKKKYWDKMQLDNVNCPMMQMLLFNQGVNIGCGGAIKRAQCVINDNFHGTLVRDGGIGKLTLAALNQISLDSQSSLFVSKYILSLIHI